MQLTKCYIVIHLKNFKHVSYERSTAPQRLGAMHSNEVMNVKARCETSCEMKLHDVVVKDEKTATLNDLMLSVKEK